MNNGAFQNEYEAAKAYAKNIISVADQIQDTFNSMDSIMTQLGNDWKSAGATEVIDMYNGIAASYPKIHEKIVNHAKATIGDVDRYQQSDSTASKMVENS